MRDANRLRRLVWNGPAPAPVASKPRTRAASGLRPAANTGCLPGAWLSGAERSPDFRRKRRRARRIRPPPQSSPDAEGERRNGAPGGATSSQGGVHIRISCAAWRAVPSLPDEERNETNLGRRTRRENEGGCTQ